jgi:hypothetical protein
VVIGRTDVTVLRPGRAVCVALCPQYFADRNIFCAGRVEIGDIERVTKATGAKMQTTVNNLDPKVSWRSSALEIHLTARHTSRVASGRGAAARGGGRRGVQRSAHATAMKGPRTESWPPATMSRGLPVQVLGTCERFEEKQVRARHPRHAAFVSGTRLHFQTRSPASPPEAFPHLNRPCLHAPPRRRLTPTQPARRRFSLSHARP